MLLKRGDIYIYIYRRYSEAAGRRRRICQPQGRIQSRGWQKNRVGLFPR